MGVILCDFLQCNCLKEHSLLYTLNCNNFCCFTQTTTPTQQPRRQLAGKEDERLVEKLIQQIELRKEGSANDREISEVRQQNANLQTALRDERQQKENAVREERREKEELQRRAQEQDQKIAKVTQQNSDLRRSFRDEQLQKEHAIAKKRREKGEILQRL